MYYGTGNGYPKNYTDPDVTDAEHLTLAAYHLIEAGYGDAAEPFIQAVRHVFEDVRVNLRLKPPAKALGRVQYLPCGILRYADGSETKDVPAAPYAYGDEEQRAKEHRNAVAGRGAASCRKAYMGWFSEKQASAAYAGRLPNTATFRPAAILKKITALCGAYDPAMPKDAALLLADKLHAVMLKNPMSRQRWTKLRQDLADFGGSRYHYEEDPALGFAYLSEAQVRIAADIIERDDDQQQNDLAQIQPQVVKWLQCNRDAMRDIDGMLDHGHEECWDSIPFLKRNYEAYYPDTRPEGRGTSYYDTQEYHMNMRLRDAFGTMQDVNDLMRCHAALCRHDDEYLHGLLLECKMVDEDLDASMPPDLHIRAALLMAVTVYKPCGSNGAAPDTELAAMAESAVPAILAHCGALERLDSDLLHPVPEEDGTGDGTVPGTENAS